MGLLLWVVSTLVRQTVCSCSALWEASMVFLPEQIVCKTVLNKDARMVTGYRLSQIFAGADG